VNEVIKIRCNVILGRFIFWEIFVGICMVAEYINLYWTHTVQSTNTGVVWTAFVCTVYETVELSGTIVILITSL
jgi:hypothetical protein